MNDTSAIQIRNPEETNLCSGLYLVPTPIGNLRDITLRALDVLTACDVIVCEDSRVTGKLLKAYDIKVKKKIVYNDHADDTTKTYILDLIDQGNIVALVSDAGTPLISDPGYKLVRSCLERNLYVTALPGANAVLPALQLSGMATDRFTFAGFLPAKDKAVRDMLGSYKHAHETLVFYDSPKRVLKSLSVMAEIIPNRRIALVREISKLFEEVKVKTVIDLIAEIENHPVKGEVALVVEGNIEKTDDAINIDEMIEEGLKNGLSIKDIAADLAVQTGMKKKDIYNRALDLKDHHTL